MRRSQSPRISRLSDLPNSAGATQDNEAGPAAQVAIERVDNASAARNPFGTNQVVGKIRLPILVGVEGLPHDAAILEFEELFGQQILKSSQDLRPWYLVQARQYPFQLQSTGSLMKHVSWFSIGSWNRRSTVAA